MRILIEGYHYDAADVQEALGNVVETLTNVEGKAVVNYVGYLYNPHINDCVFILPKVLVDRDGKVFSRLEPEMIINLERAVGLKEEERRFIYEFAVWIYRALSVYKDKHKESDIVYYQRMTQVGNRSRHIANTYLEVLLALIDFNRKNQNFFMTIVKNQHSGFNKINWTRTISRQTAYIQNDAPLYLHPINKRRLINFDEELLVIFFSILAYINGKYGFPVNINFGFELITGERFKHYLNGFGLTRLRQIKYKYFSDKALYLWDLCYAFFERSDKISVASELKEYLIAKDFNNVFESIIDELVGDKREDLPDKLKDQKDGKRVDHLYMDKPLTTADEKERSIFYIGDSKYYELKNEIGEEAVYKQYTYARNVIQWNMNLFLDPKEDEENLRWRKEILNYRDEETEGYNIVPNFFISARMAENLSYADDITQTVRDNKSHISRHFENRLFDRDTLLIYHYDVNFLYVVSLYARNDDGQKRQWKAKVRQLFREEIQKMLGEHFHFYALQAHPNVNASQYISEHFKDVLGKMYRPYSNSNYFSLALEDREEYREENAVLLAELRKHFYITDCRLGENPTAGLEKAVAEMGTDFTPEASDMVLCIMFDNVHEKVKAAGSVTRIAQGLAMTESALRLTGDISKTRYVLLHNKHDYYVYKVIGAPRLVSRNDVGNAIIKLEGKDLYIVFDVNPTPLKVEIDTKKLAVNTGDDRISYYSTMIEFSKLLVVKTQEETTINKQKQ